MSAPDEAEGLRLIDRLCDRFEAEWQAGRRPAWSRFWSVSRRPFGTGCFGSCFNSSGITASGPTNGRCWENTRRLPDNPAVVLEVFVPKAADRPTQQGAGGDEELSLTLAVIEGPCKGREFRFTGHEFFLAGRSAQAHLHIPGDNYLSRLHFLVEVNPPVCRLTDLGSRNRTLVNGVPVQSVDLGNGDVIKVGRTSLRILIDGRAGTPTQAAAAPAAGPRR